MLPSRKVLLACLLLFAALSAGAQTLTLTARNYVIHQGDFIPPWAYNTSGFSGSDVWGTAVASGIPLLTSTVTASTVPGTYTLNIAQGSMVAQNGYSFAFVPGTITVIPADQYGAKLYAAKYGPNFAINALTQTLCGQIYGDGVHDDTANILCLLTTYRTNPTGFYGTNPKIVYFPTANYLLTDRLLWNGASVTVWGDGPGKTVFKVPPNTPAYSNAAAPRDVLHWGDPQNGNTAFYNYGENFSIEIGPGNPGARALNFAGSNFAGVRNVAITSDDGLAICGICMPNAYPGPLMVRNIFVDGFTYGFSVSNSEYNTTNANITVENSKSVGIQNTTLDTQYQNIFLYTPGATPMTFSRSSSQVVGARIAGSGTTAITAGTAAAGTLYLRDVQAPGYTNTLVDNGTSPATTVAGGTTAEYWTGTASTLFGTANAGMLKLPLLPLPNATDDPNTANWLALSSDITTWGTQIAASTATTAYVPVLHNYSSGGAVDTSNDVNWTGNYKATTGYQTNITVPDTMNHIAMDEFHEGTSGAAVNITVAGSSSTPLVIDHFASVVNLIHTGSRTVVVKSGELYSYTCTNGAGDVFFEDVAFNTTTTFCPGQHVYS